MEIVKPNIPCEDFWPEGTLDMKRKQVYKFAEATGEIEIKKVVACRSNGSVTVYYLSNVPHEWMIDKLKKYVEEVAN